MSPYSTIHRVYSVYRLLDNDPPPMFQPTRVLVETAFVVIIVPKISPCLLARPLPRAAPRTRFSPSQNGTILGLVVVGRNLTANSKCHTL